MQAYVDQFNSGSAEAVAALYADSATVEDPVGSPLKQGKPAILAFYKSSIATGALDWMTSPDSHELDRLRVPSASTTLRNEGIPCRSSGGK